MKQFFDGLFYNNAEKIKSNAKRFGTWALILSIVSGIIGFFILAPEEDVGIAILALLGAITTGLLLLAISRIFYGFGEIITLLEVANGNTFHIHKLLDENIKKDK